MTATESLRNRFETEFQLRLNLAALAVVPRWFAPLFPEDSLIAAWISKETKRTLRVQVREPGDAIRFDWVVGRSGESEECEDLLLDIVPEALDPEAILMIYRLWFLDLAPVHDVVTELEGVAGSLR